MRATVLVLLALAAGWPAQAAPKDATEARLDACLDSPDGVSTAGQTECYGAALKAYDARMNAAYGWLVKRLPAAAVKDLRTSQRAWIAFRDAERRANLAVFSTRQGTMYVPMASASALSVVRDRALALEAYVRVMTIEGP
ncbi:MAG: lysozyme inhibitor LprI family protein [Phenylobacterium sp.]